MGWGVFDESLNKLLTEMETMSPNLQLPSLMGYAKMIGLCLALGVGANECYQMMLGRRGMDVMKLIHIVIISLCISSAGTIAKIASQPGKLMEGIVKDKAMGMNNAIEEKEKEVAKLQEDYINQVREAMQKLEQAQEAANANKRSDAHWWEFEKIKDTLEETTTHIANQIKQYTLVLETKICEWISLILRLIGEVLLQAIIYGLLVSQRIFMHLLEMVAPIMFAISLSPHFKSAWSQWLSKYISLSLWGFVTYVCMYYVFFIIDYNLAQDKVAYEVLQEGIQGDNAQVAAIGMQAMGSTCMYIIGILVGVKVLSMVPEAASWLIPGGVSSSAGSAAGGTVTAGAMAGASMAGGVAMGAVKKTAPLAIGEVKTVLNDVGSAAGAIGAIGEWNRNKNWDAANNAARHMK